MAVKQKFGIKYPFTAENDDGLYIDLNDSYDDYIKSQVLHVLFTPKGQRIRKPDFGCDFIKYLFGPKDSDTFAEIKSEITSQIQKYVPSVEFRDVTVYNSDGDEHSVVVMVEYAVKKGNKNEVTTVAVKVV